MLLNTYICSEMSVRLRCNEVYEVSNKLTRTTSVFLSVRFDATFRTKVMASKSTFVQPSAQCCAMQSYSFFLCLMKRSFSVFPLCFNTWKSRSKQSVIATAQIFFLQFWMFSYLYSQKFLIYSKMQLELAHSKAVLCSLHQLRKKNAIGAEVIILLLGHSQFLQRFYQESSGQFIYE